MRKNARNEDKKEIVDMIAEDITVYLKKRKNM